MRLLTVHLWPFWVFRFAFYNLVTQYVIYMFMTGCLLLLKISVNRSASQNISFFEVTILTGVLMTPPCTLEYFELVVNLAKTVR